MFTIRVFAPLIVVGYLFPTTTVVGGGQAGTAQVLWQFEAGG